MAGAVAGALGNVAQPHAVPAVAWRPCCMRPRLQTSTVSPMPRLCSICKAETRGSSEPAQADPDQFPDHGNSERKHSSTAARGSEYYAGLLKNDLRTTNDATASDILGRSLQLAAGVAALLALLTYGFLASNGLV